MGVLVIKTKKKAPKKNGSLDLLYALWTAWGQSDVADEQG